MTKRLLIILSFLFAFNVKGAFDTIIHFRKTTYLQVFELAKQEKKPVLIYFHHDGCHDCGEMENTAFKDKKTASFYNSHFVCFDVNTLKGEGADVNKIYKIKTQPAFLFLNENGNELHKIVGIFNGSDFLSQAKIALSSKKRLAFFKQSYKDGKRDTKFLFKYCYMLRDINELDSLTVNEYLNRQALKTLGKEKNIRFIYEFCVNNYHVTTPYKSIPFTFLLNNRSKFYRYFSREQVDTRIVWILNAAIIAAIEKQDEILFNEITGVIKEFDTGKTYLFEEMDGRTTGILPSGSIVLTSKIEYYDKSGNDDKYNETLKIYLNKIWNEPDALNEFARFCCEKYNNTVKLETAVECVKRSISLNNKYANNDTYAALLYKLGQYGKALIQAGKAIDLAKNNNTNYSGTTTLISEIKNKQKK